MKTVKEKPYSYGQMINEIIKKKGKSMTDEDKAELLNLTWKKLGIRNKRVEG